MTGIRLPRIEVTEPDVDDARIIAARCVTEAAEYVALGETAKARTLIEVALIWLDGMP